MNRFGYFVLIFSLITMIGFGSSFSQHIPTARAQNIVLEQSSQSVHQVRLEMKLLSHQTKIIGDAVVSEDSDQNITVVESTFKVKARAFGGDIYLPTYREDIVFEPVITFPEEGTNAVILGIPAIALSRELPMEKEKYLLHEYEEVEMTITVPLKVLTKAMPSRLIMKTKLNTILWYPTVYENGLNDPGISPDTGERLIQIPLINATYIPVQVTRLDWETEPVVLLRGGKVFTAVKKDFREYAAASVFGILNKLFFK